MFGRIGVSGLVALALLLGVSPPASADAPGPTNYQSEVLHIKPEVAGVQVNIIGGDSFVQLIVDPGIEVVVIGYTGEPYLRVLASGVVEENQLSPAKYLNEERFGDGDIPAEATHEASPKWKQIGDRGTWSWHDHRTHLMSRNDPVAAEVGDQINEGVIPLIVDGVDVKVAVATYWLAGPPLLPTLAAGLLSLVGAVIVMSRSTRWPALLVALVSLAALGVGITQNVTLPLETGPSPLNWLLPCIGLAAIAALALNRWLAGDSLAPAGVLLASLNLVMWGYLRRQGLVSAILPGNGPASLDRVTTVAAMMSGGVVGAAIVRDLLKPQSTSAE